MNYTENKNATFLSHEHSLDIKPNFEQIKNITSRLQKLDTKKGWPPRVYSENYVELIPSVIDLITPSIKTFRKATKYVLSNKKILGLLGDHWVHVITQHITQTDYKPQESSQISHFEFRLLFYSYTSNRSIEVLLQGKSEIKINIIDDIHIPETFEEIQNAIKLAKEDERISKYVAKLEANAILEPLIDSSHDSYNNRIMRVMFTEKYDKFKELPVLFCALIDLNTKSVLYAGEAPCI